MRTLAHLSDLHFGTETPRVVESLQEDLLEIAPSLVIVSGDLTQRARTCQFHRARDFLRELPGPQLVVPGNHDIPLFDVARRFLAPLKRYCRIITSNLNPIYHDDEIFVLGINTARSLTWKNGRISAEQMVMMKQTFSAVQRPLFKIVVTHHPFIPPPGRENGSVELVGRARHALKVMDHCKVDLLLAGHLHHGYTGDVRTHYPATQRSMIVAQAGTATSHRLRGEPNAYNLITLDRDSIVIAVRVWTDGRFQHAAELRYTLHLEEWVLENGLEIA
jgi:3',5'-cyclic AMP phosphodiesterase CpdA